MASEWDERNAPAVAYAESIIGPIIEQRDAARAEAARYREALRQVPGLLSRIAGQGYTPEQADRSNDLLDLVRAALAHQDGSDDE